MAAEKKETCYQDSCVQRFQFYLEHSGEHQAIFQNVHSVLPGEFKRIGEGKSSLDVLGVGSGGGEVDVQILTLLQAMLCPSLLTLWRAASSSLTTLKMIYYVEDMAETIKFYQSLLKNNGRLMIIIEAANGGWDILWKTFQKDLCCHSITEYRSSGELTACLKKLGLKYEEHPIPNFFDILECFDPKSQLGCGLLNFMAVKDDFHQSFTPEIRAAILDLLKNKCSIQKNGKVLFNSTLSCILIHA